MSDKRVKLILVRHGETAWNRDRRIQGQIDIALNPTGEAQAIAVADYLAGEDIDGIYASDLKRALSTAEAIARRLGLDVVACADLRERHWGRYQGMRFDEIAREAGAAHARMVARERDYVLEGDGESLAMLARRVQAALESIAGRHPGGTVVVVAHGGVLDAAYRLASGLPLEAARTFDLPNAAVNVIGFDDGRWRIEAWAGIDHLAGLSRYDELSER